MVDRIIIEVPEPCVVVLIGAAGSGKSTLAARSFAPGEILSSDAFRAMVSGSESDQRATRTAFSILHRQLAKRLGAHLARTTGLGVLEAEGYAAVHRVRTAEELDRLQIRRR